MDKNKTNPDTSKRQRLGQSSQIPSNKSSRTENQQTLLTPRHLLVEMAKDLYSGSFFVKLTYISYHHHRPNEKHLLTESSAKPQQGNSAHTFNKTSASIRRLELL